jgi:phage terminase small subunit
MPAYAGNPALTPRQQRFVESYLLDLNATQAAIRAGYSKRTAQEKGSQLLSHPAIRSAIDARKIERSNETKIAANWVLMRLAAEAEADVADLYGDNGNLKPVHEWPKIWRQGLVQGIEVEELFEGSGDDRKHVGTLRKIRLELIGKHVNVQAFKEQIEVGGLDALADRLERASKRTDAHQTCIPAPPVLEARAVDQPVAKLVAEPLADRIARTAARQIAPLSEQAERRF